MPEITVYDEQGKMKKLVTNKKMFFKGDKCYCEDDQGNMIEVPNPMKPNIKKKAITFEA